MTLSDDIEKTFTLNISDGPTAMECDGYPFYSFNDGDEFGVVVIIGSAAEDVDETFANARFYTRYGYLGIEEHTAILSCSDLRYAHRFADLCADFVDPGPEGKQRNDIVKDPASWWRMWKSMLGNKDAEQMTYSVLGEMMAVDRLYRIGCNPKWEGLKRGVRDIVGTGYSVEVKSTVERYSKVIQAAGEFQFEEQNNAFLYFCRFEESESGISIDQMADIMVSDGCMNRQELEDILSESGLPRGRFARKNRFRLIEMIEYRIDESFPCITARSFKGDAIPKGISHIEYSVDLNAVESFRRLDYVP